MNCNMPYFSIVIPTHDRNQQLLYCIKTILGITYPRHRFEVIVVDDGSRVPVRWMLSSYFEKLNLRVFYKQKAGPASARNLGARVAKGEYLVFLDDDCTPDPSWLQRLAIRTIQAPDKAIGGLTVNMLQKNRFSCATQLVVDYLYNKYNRDARNARFFIATNFAVPADGFANVEGFDENMPFAGGEERELWTRWINKGYSMTFAPEVVVYHKRQLNLASFCKQHFIYGRGSQIFRRKKAGRNLKGKRLEPISFYLGLLIYPFKMAKGGRIPTMLLLIAISQFATALGFLCEFICFKK